MIRNLTPIVKNLLIINGLVFLALSLKVIPDSITAQYFLLWKTDVLGLRTFLISLGMPLIPPGNFFEPLQVLTHFFTHIQLYHILFNMLALASLGPLVETVLRPERFLKFYLFCGILGGILVALLDPSPNPVLGASGAISGVVLAFARFFPRQKLSIFFIGSFEAEKLVKGFIIISIGLFLLEFMRPGAGAGISHFGHLMGFLAGWLYFKVEHYIPPFR